MGESSDVAALVEELAAAKSWVEAASRARGAVDAGAARGPVYVALARGLFRSGASERCLAILDHLPAVERVQNDGTALRVQALLELGRREEALHIAERELLRAPEDTAMTRLLARARGGVEPRVAVEPMLGLRRARRMLEIGHAVRALRMVREMVGEGVTDGETLALLEQVSARVKAEASSARRRREAVPPVRSTPTPIGGDV